MGDAEAHKNYSQAEWKKWHWNQYTNSERGKHKLLSDNGDPRRAKKALLDKLGKQSSEDEDDADEDDATANKKKGKGKRGNKKGKGKGKQGAGDKKADKKMKA